MTTPIGGRYHPMLIAQASGTLGNMFPGRFKLAVGSGEALNEAYFPSGWPPIEERTDRLVEGIALIRKLWERDEFFDFQGTYFPMKGVYLYTKPQPIPPIYFSSLGPKSAYYAGKFGDHLFTLIVNISAVANTFEKCKDKIFPGFEAGAKAAGRDPSRMERVVGLTLVFEGRNAYLTENRKFAGLYTKGTLDEPDPRKIEGRDPSSVTDDELVKDVYFCSNWDDAVDVLKKFQDIGATEVAIGTGTNQNLIRLCAEKLLPHFSQ